LAEGDFVAGASGNVDSGATRGVQKQGENPAPSDSRAFEHPEDGVGKV